MAAAAGAAGFEGSEKRMEVTCAFGSRTPHRGLRHLSRSQLDGLLRQASCTIVSSLFNDSCDAYVLSESSLFVYTTKLVLKTCGTTQPLSAVPQLLQLICGLDMGVTHIRYSRASFLFPQSQPQPHHCFNAEAAFLQPLLQPLGLEGAHAVLGDEGVGLQWHLYQASQPAAVHDFQDATTLEVCMTRLCPDKAAGFCRGGASPAAVTCTTGIRALLPGAVIDDYVFQPCGYSMNGLEGPLASSIHVTPERGWSYASFELSGPALPDVAAVAAQVAEVFHPDSMTVTLSGAHPADSLHAASSWRALPCYQLTGTARHSPAGQHPTLFLSFDRQPAIPPAEHHPARSAAEKPSSSAAQREPPSSLQDAAEQLADDAAQQLPAAAIGTAAEFVPVFASPATEQDAPAGLYGTSPAAGGSLYGSSAPPRTASLPLSEAFPDENPSSASTTPRSSLSESRPESPSAAAYLTAAPALGTKALPEARSLQACSSAVGHPALSIEALLASYKVQQLPDARGPTTAAHLASLIRAQQLEDPVYLLDLGCAARLMAAWRAALPRVTPCYAVKCNDDPALLRLLACLGAGFDCASDQELGLVLGMGVDPDRIVFANPCKRLRDVRAAAQRSVNLTTFDTVAELQKLAAWHPCTAALLRIRADDPEARCPLGHKYGAEADTWDALLVAAKELGIRVTGISFHVGSGATNPSAFAEAIMAARDVFDRGLKQGFPMRVLDIGGGFCHQETLPSSFPLVADAVNAGLEQYFPDPEAYHIISEPGRFFAEASSRLACMVIGSRPAPGDQDSIAQDLWITDGLYGSFNCLLYDHALLAPEPLFKEAIAGDSDAAAARAGNSSCCPARVFGPTCDGADLVLQQHPLPTLSLGDWLVFPNLGAYSLVGACKFNGIDAVDVPKRYVWSAQP